MIKLLIKLIKHIHQANNLSVTVVTLFREINCNNVYKCVNHQVITYLHLTLLKYSEILK